MSSILRKAYHFLINQNLINLRGNGSLHASATMKGVNIQGNVVVGPKSIIKFVEIMGTVTIGQRTTINGPNVQILSRLNPITIGSYCSIARDVSIQEYNHRTDRVSTYNVEKHIFKGRSVDDATSKGPIVIGNDVWVGTKSVILSGVSIGHGAIVAAGSVVTRNVPPFAIVGGSPARIIRFRFSPEIIEALLGLGWWDWTDEKIRQNRDLFTTEVTLAKIENITKSGAVNNAN